MDHYKVLNVHKNASADEIKKAYRKLASKWHPDKNPNKLVAEQKFKQISASYQALFNESKQRQYKQTSYEKDSKTFSGGFGVFGGSDRTQIEHFNTSTSSDPPPKYLKPASTVHGAFVNGSSTNQANYQNGFSTSSVSFGRLINSTVHGASQCAQIIFSDSSDDESSDDECSTHIGLDYSSDSSDDMPDLSSSTKCSKRFRNPCCSNYLSRASKRFKTNEDRATTSSEHLNHGSMSSTKVDSATMQHIHGKKIDTITEFEENGRETVRVYKDGQCTKKLVNGKLVYGSEIMHGKKIETWKATLEDGTAIEKVAEDGVVTKITVNGKEVHFE